MATGARRAWVTQQARNLGLDFSDRDVRFLIRDRDSKCSGPSDEVFRSDGIRIVKRPHRALELRPPEPDERRERPPNGEIRRRDQLGGLIHVEASSVSRPRLG